MMILHVNVKKPSTFKSDNLNKSRYEKSFFKPYLKNKSNLFAVRTWTPKFFFNSRTYFKKLSKDKIFKICKNIALLKKKVLWNYLPDFFISELKKLGKSSRLILSNKYVSQTFDDVWCCRLLSHFSAILSLILKCKRDNT